MSSDEVFILPRKRSLTNDVDAKDLVSLLLGNELDHTLSVEVGLGSAVGKEGEFADLVRNTSSFELLLVLANPSNFRVGIDDRRNGIVVDVTVTLLDDLSGSNTLLFGFVCQHGTESNISNGVHASDTSVELVVNDNATTLVEFYANFLKVQRACYWTTANRDKDNVCFQLSKEQSEVRYSDSTF